MGLVHLWTLHSRALSSITIRWVATLFTSEIFISLKLAGLIRHTMEKNKCSLN